MLNLVLHLLHLGLDGGDLLVHRLGVETRDLPDGLLHEPVDVFHDDVALDQRTVFLHGLEDGVLLRVPGREILLFQQLVNAVLEEDALQGVVVPLVFQFGEPDLQLALQQLQRVVRVVDEDVLDRQELRLVVYDDAGVRRDVALAVGEGVQGVDGLVRRNVVGQVDEDLHLVRRHVLDLLDLDLPLVLRFQDGVDQHVRRLPVGHLGDCDRVLVDLLDAGADLYAPAPGSVLVGGAVGEAAGGEIRVDGEVFPTQDVDGGVEQFVEVVREDLGSHAHGNAFRALRQQQREADRQFGRLLVAAVVGIHVVGDLRVEDDLLREFAEPGLDVSRRGVAVPREDVAPVPLAVDHQAFLAQLDEGAEDGLVAVRVVLHRLSDDVRHLGETAVIDPRHRVQHTPLDRLETVHDVRDRPLQDHIGRIIQEPVLEHRGQLELLAVRSQQPVVLAARPLGDILHRIFIHLLFSFLLLFGRDLFPFVFCHLFLLLVVVDQFQSS